MVRLIFSVIVLLLAGAPFAPGQREATGASEIKHSLDRLNVLGRVLMIAAHPDDENTAVLAYFARGRKMRTGYLSLTRGEGGQNLIGSEQGDELGVIRTQELLAARRIDGAEQFFSRAIDFGFSKTPDETLKVWGREPVLADMVWVIRRFRPDVILFRFSGTPRDGHGQHQTSAILGKEAVEAAADANRFPEQFQYGVQPWKTTRAFFNSFSFTAEQEREASQRPGRLEIDTGEFDRVLGRSYGEIAGLSRSQHRSQAMGSPERKGPQRQWFFLVSGEPATKDLFDGIDVSWNRIGREDLTKLFAEATRTFDVANPEKTIALLLQARPLVAAIPGEWGAAKLKELDETIALCAGLALEAVTDKPVAVPGGSVAIRGLALNRSRAAVTLESVTLEGVPGVTPFTKTSALAYNAPLAFNFDVELPADTPYTEPYWLAPAKQGSLYGVKNQTQIGLPENPPFLTALFRVVVEGQTLEFRRPVQHRYVDRVYGELLRPFTVVPPVGLDLPERSFFFIGNQPRPVEVSVKANLARVSGSLALQVPEGWKVAPASQPFQLRDAGDQVTLTFSLTPPAAAATGGIRAVAAIGTKSVSQGVVTINYPHIPVQTVYPQATARVVRADVQTLTKRVGYVMGAGDEVPAALKQAGIDVTLLSADDLARGDLSRYEAIVTGVRAWNVRADLRANQQRLLAFMQQGGTLVVQYNVLEGGFMGGDPKLLEKVGPYPITISRDRVTVEEAPVKFLKPESPLLAVPNQISDADFTGWVQERGLYFAGKWDERYQPLFETHDPGEPEMQGSTLVAPYGKGAYVFTAFSWFRQLPAGVPGAFRIFANLLSAGKSLSSGGAAAAK
jgi:LmbE family N-acetylglucosaminyl deacetylase